MQCYTCSIWVHLKCSLLFFFIFKTLGSSYSWSRPPCCVHASSGDPNLSTVCLPLRILPASIPPLFDLAHLALPLLMQHSPPPSPSNILPSFCPLFISSLCTLHTPSCFWLFFYTSCFLFPLTGLGFFNEMLVNSGPGAPNYYTLSHPILLTLSLFNYPVSTHLPLSRSLSFLLCDLIMLIAHSLWHFFSR